MNIKTVRWVIYPAVAILLAFPFLTLHLSAPNWHVVVVDANGKPVPDLWVSETRQNYSCEEEEHVSKLTTNGAGEVDFPSVSVRRNPLKCAAETASELMAGIHASLGDHVRIDVTGVICVTDGRGYCVDWSGKPSQMNTRVVIR